MITEKTRAEVPGPDRGQHTQNRHLGSVASARITRSPARCVGCDGLLGDAHVRGCRFAELT